ncbi:hypothetical protein [Streptosporangium sandarakinum]
MLASQRSRRVVATQAALVLASAAALTAVTAAPAAASPSDCDNYSFDYFKHVGSGVSFTAYGRTIHLRNGASFNHSFAMIYNGYQRGDQVWADRSVNPMPSGVPTYFSGDGPVSSRGGWKQCGPFKAERSKQVMNWNTKTQRHFAVRACFRPKDGRPSVCGKWYVDRS